MVITNNGLDGISDYAGGSGTAPNYIAIGSKSTAATTSDTTMAAEWDRNICSSRDLSTAKQATYIGDFSTSETSGLTVWEIGLYNTGSSLFMRNVVGSYTFGGDTELQVQMTVQYT